MLRSAQHDGEWILSLGDGKGNDTRFVCRLRLSAQTETALRNRYWYAAFERARRAPFFI
jgi:hypothetical protein